MNNASTSPQRLTSLDALRGFDMCWILGLGGLLQGVLQSLFADSNWAQFVSAQLEHVPWGGFHFYDLIFPLFIFLSGISLALALPRRLQRDGTAACIRHVLARGLVLFLLGVFFSGGMRDGWDKIRWLGVLQRIGIASAVAGVLSLGLSTRALVVTTAGILLGYAALMTWVPVPGVEVPGFEEGRNLANYLDSIWLPGRRYNGTHDPEGILSTLPAVASALLGVLAGRWVQSGRAPVHIARTLVIAGLALVAVGWAWHPLFPVIKKIWTSSFVLVAGGWSCVLLGLFYWLIDIKGWKGWTPPFIWVGSNPITLYMLGGMGLFRTVSERLVTKAEPSAGWLASTASFMAMMALARWLHRKGVFIRV